MLLAGLAFVFLQYLVDWVLLSLIVSFSSVSGGLLSLIVRSGHFAKYAKYVIWTHRTSTQAVKGI